MQESNTTHFTYDTFVIRSFPWTQSLMKNTFTSTVLGVMHEDVTVKELLYRKYRRHDFGKKGKNSSYRWKIW